MTQSEWDHLLVTCFYEHMDVPISMIYCGEFDSSVKRTPREAHHMYMTVARFVSEYLPKLSKVLWDTPAKHKDKIIRALSKSSMDTSKNVTSKSKQEIYMRAKIRRDQAAATIGGHASSIHADKSNGHHWKICK